MRLKVSRYNLNVGTGAETYLVNTVSGAAIRLGEKEHKSLSGILNLIDEAGGVHPHQKIIADFLLEHGFVVPADVDELERVLNKYDQGRSNSSTLSLLITPTMRCNMGCFYCFQDRSNQSSLKKYDIDAIIQFAAGRLEQLGKLHVTWFGGEPLLDKDFIFETSTALIDLANSRKASYSASMVSNGYYLDNETAINLQKYKVKSIQVTFDGSQQDHDKIRRHLMPLSDRRIGSFFEIVKNLLFASNFLEITIRVNVTRINVGGINILIDELASAGLAEKVKGIYFHPVFNYKTSNPKANYQPKEGVHFSIQDYAEVEVEYLAYAVERGFRIPDPLKPNYSGCGAVQKNSFIIDSNGEIKKCNNDIGKPGTAFTSLYTSDITDTSNLTPWDDYRPEANPGCGSCSFLPVCYSHCPHRNINSPEAKPDKCPSNKYNWQRTLPLVLKQREQLPMQSSDERCT